MRAQGQTFQPITGQSWLQACSAARINLDINAFKISENCIPCDFLTFQKSTLLFLCAPKFKSKPAVLHFVVEGVPPNFGSMLGFDMRRRSGAAVGPGPSPPVLPVNISKLERAAARAGRFLISWWRISQNCDPEICRHPPSWIFLIQDQGLGSV